jgi:hypothetical protein
MLNVILSAVGLAQWGEIISEGAFQVEIFNPWKLTYILGGHEIGINIYSCLPT